MFADRPDLTFAPPPLVAALPRVWRARDLILGTLLGVALVPLAIVIVLAVSRVDASREVAGVAGTLALEAAMGGIVILLAARRGLGREALGLVWPRRWGPFVTAWLGAHGIIIVYTLTVLALGRMGVNVNRFEGGNSIPLQPGSPWPVLALFGVTAVLVAPVCEELFFRSLLYRGMRGFWSIVPALALSGLCFGLFHMNLGVLVPFTLIGALFAWSTEASGSLLTSISAHIMVNGLAFAVTAAGLAPPP